MFISEFWQTFSRNFSQPSCKWDFATKQQINSLFKQTSNPPPTGKTRLAPESLKTSRSSAPISFPLGSLPISYTLCTIAHHEGYKTTVPFRSTTDNESRTMKNDFAQVLLTKIKSTHPCQQLSWMVAKEGIEPSTQGLWVLCSTDWATSPCA